MIRRQPVGKNRRVVFVTVERGAAREGAAITAPMIWFHFWVFLEIWSNRDIKSVTHLIHGVQRIQHYLRKLCKKSLDMIEEGLRKIV